MNQYYCKNYILITFHYGLSTQNWIWNSANHGDKSVEKGKEASFIHFQDLFKPFWWFACFHGITFFKLYLYWLATNWCKGQRNRNGPLGHTGAVARAQNCPKCNFKLETGQNGFFRGFCPFHIVFFRVISTIVNKTITSTSINKPEGSNWGL